MADLGETSQADTAHKHKTSSWVTVGLLVMASILLGAALITRWLPLAVLGALLLIAGVVTGYTGRIMDDAH